MATQVQFRRGTTAQNASFTGALGEVTVDTDKDTLVVHDGGTAGGFEISRADASNLKFPDGAVGTPAISFASDTNTGIYRGGTDILKFVTAGTDAITINASQATTFASTITSSDITISDNNPTLIFDDANGVDQNFTFAVNGGTANIQSRTDAGVNTTRLTVSSNGNIDFKGGDISFYEDTGSTPKMVWDSSEEALAIGHSSPATPLDIRQTNTGSDTGIRVYNLDNSNTTTQTASLFLSPDSRGNGALVFGEKENADFSTSAGRDVSLVFSPVLNNTQTRAMTILSSGNVGIGSASPLTALHIQGGEPDIFLRRTDLTNKSWRFNVQSGTGDLNIKSRNDDGSAVSTSMVIHHDGYVTKPLQPAFQAYGNTDTSISSLATFTTTIFNNEIFDQNGDFNTANYRFTAPVTGKYQLNAIVRLADLQNDSTFYIVQINTSNREYKVILDSNVYSADLDYHSFTISVLADMDASDIAEVQAYQNTGTIGTYVVGNTNYTVFSGYLVA